MDKLSSEDMPSSDPSPCEKPVGKSLWAVVIFLGLCLLYLVGLAIWATWNWYAYRQVVSTEEVGRIVGASYTASFTIHTTAIQTTTGTYIAQGFMQAVNGHPVRIEHRGNGERALCDGQTGACLKMLGK